jgi:hypothetical protein
VKFPFFSSFSERLQDVCRQNNTTSCTHAGCVEVSSITNGDIRLTLKTPWRDGSEFLLFTPSEFRGGGPLEKLLTLIPLPRFHPPRGLPLGASRGTTPSSLPHHRIGRIFPTALSPKQMTTNLKQRPGNTLAPKLKEKKTGRIDAAI